MREQYKLGEAEYFLSRMWSENENPSAFAFELSAFLGAARSVTQYARKEAVLKPGGLAWYDNAVTLDPLFAFLKDQRDDNIHSIPVRPATAYKGQIAEFLQLDDETIIPYRHNTTTILHQFVGWPGDESVLQLSRRYLDALRGLVHDGVARAMITG
jgi:hypothetical protein